MEASTSALSSNKINELQQEGDFAIKSEAVTPKLGECHSAGFEWTTDRTSTRYLAMAITTQEL
jgi:hypothetical protein